MTRADLSALLRRVEREEEETTLANACAQAGLGVSTVRSRDRRADVARRRAVVVWVLKRAGWTQPKIGRVLGRTDRQVRKLLASFPPARADNSAS